MELIIVGAGGQGKVVAGIIDAARRAGADCRAVGVVDDQTELHGTTRFGLRVLGAMEVLRNFAHDGIVVAIGDNALRRAVTERLGQAGELLVTVQHPFSSIASEVTVGPGSMISAGVVVAPGARIGNGVLLNTKSSVDHDTVVGNFAHVSPGATIGGSVILGDEVLIGLGASVMSGLRIGSRTVVGAGAVAVSDLPAGIVATGVPARPMPSR